MADDLRRSERLNKGTIPKQYEAFIVDMKKTSTPNSNQTSSDQESVDMTEEEHDNTIQQAGQDLEVQTLLKEMKALQSNFNSLAQKLQDSDKRNKMLEEKLKSYTDDQSALTQRIESTNQTPPVGNEEQPVNSNTSNAPNVNVVSNENIHRNVVTPKALYDLPEFYGHPEQWPIFITAFKESTATYGYSNLENTFRLQKALKGSAKEEVEGMLIDPVNVPHVIDQLEFKYGRPGFLIKSQLQKISEIAPIPDNHMERIIPYATKVKNLTIFLKNSNAKQHLSNPVLIEDLVSKLPMSKKIEWAEFSSKILPYPSIEHFSSWIEEKSKIISKVFEDLPVVPAATRSQNNRQYIRSSKTVFNTVENKEEKSQRKIMCTYCKGEHYFSTCSKFAGLGIDEKWKIVNELRACFSCLRQGHNIRNCKSRKTCNIDGCKQKHNKLLHIEKIETPYSIDNPNVEVINSTRLTTSPLLFKVIPIEVEGPNKNIIETFGFIDEGSSTTLIDEDLALQLGVHEAKESLTLQWLGNKATNIDSVKCILNVRGKGNHSQRKWYTMESRTVPNLKLPMQTINTEDLHSKYRQLRGLPLNSYKNALPKVLIGIDNIHLTRTYKTFPCGDKMIAVKTNLGWLIYGRANEIQRLMSDRNLTVLQTQELDELNRIVADYFTTESFGINLPVKQLESSENIRARSILQKTTRRIGNRFETGLLWSENSVTMPNSYNMAVNRLKLVESKMSKNKEFAEQYQRELINYVDKGYAIKLTHAERNNRGSSTWYLPHFAVTSVDKPGKMRIVFDAAAAVEGVSLNSKLIKGPDENPPLINVLFGFRKGEIGVTADIKEMFLQVRIIEKDQDSLRFLWRGGDNTKKPDEYRMVSLIFGATCSPCCAQHVKNCNAEEIAAKQEEIIKVIKNHHYVDDLVCSFESVEKAIHTCKAVKNVHKCAGFDLRRFTSNSLEVEHQLNEEDTNQKKVVPMNIESLGKVLGINWNSEVDCFTFSLQLKKIDSELINGNRHPTKRELLKIIMSVFDPLGMLANFVIYGKVLIQEVWRSGISWNEYVSSDIHWKFQQWLQCLPVVREFHLTRCYSSNLIKPGRILELHVFADASEKAFAAVAYWRIINKDSIDVSFIAGKVKCAPLKLLSMPRLELQAAILGCRLKNLIVESHDLKIDSITLWSDSKTVLFWIKSDHRNYKPFVAHRISEILETTTVKQWKWVPSKLNSADIATRPTYPINYRTDNIWIKGPEFLHHTIDYWPKQETNLSTEVGSIELKAAIFTTIDVSVIDFNRYSNYFKLKRIIAWVLRPLHRMKKPELLTSKEPSFDELEYAEESICKLVQSHVYSQEITQLKKDNTLLKQSPIYKLNPCINERGLLVIRGRLDNAHSLPIATRQPIILPSSHKLTHLIVEWFHRKYYHQNDDIIIIEIRQKFWIAHIRSVVKKVKSNCQFCKIQNAKPCQPAMGQLPEDRVTPFVRPFTYTGIDYFGPVYVTIGRSKPKRWIALFTCLTTRAIHMEIAEDLSTDSCILCIRNFVNRRGVPIQIRSDMGTNFIGTNGEIKKVKDLFDYEKLENHLSHQGIKWLFNSPANPSAGGCWERLIKAVKRVLQISLKEQAPRLETLRSFVIEAENIINSRPLTEVPVDSTSLEPITPNHFLLGSMNSTQTPGEEGAICSRKQYRVAQQLKNNFWHRWLKEYVPLLNRQQKWFSQSEPIKNGDVVIICDSNVSRSQWKKGIVINTIKAKDGQVRIADVKTESGLIRRPVSKLAVLAVKSKPNIEVYGGGDVAEH